jgi:hypothetical protein
MRGDLTPGPFPLWEGELRPGAPVSYPPRPLSKVERGDGQSLLLPLCRVECPKVVLLLLQTGVVNLRLNESGLVRCRALHLSLRAPSARVDLSSDKERLGAGDCRLRSGLFASWLAEAES